MQVKDTLTYRARSMHSTADVPIRFHEALVHPQALTSHSHAFPVHWEITGNKQDRVNILYF